MTQITDISATPAVPSVPAVAAPKPFLQVVAVAPVISRVFERLQDGTLSCFVLRDQAFVRHGGGIRFTETGRDGLATGRSIELEVLNSVGAADCMALEKGFKAISLGRPVLAEGLTQGQGRAEMHLQDQPVRGVFSQAGLRGQTFTSFVSLNVPIFDRDIIGVRTTDEAPLIRHRIAILMKGDHEGIAPGGMLVSLPQPRVVHKSAAPGWN